MAPFGRCIRVALAGVGLLATLAGPPAHLHAQESELPPLVYVCPMHADQVAHEDGDCPICGMGLEPMRLDSVYTCPIHAVVSERHPGKCPICSRTLGEITVSVAWKCGGSDKELTEPGKCADGTAAIRVQKTLAHGNHNPQHGGQFFMAADSWHHIEGTYPSPGVFRLYLFDDYTKPLAADRIAAVTARVVTKEETNPQTFEAREITAVPLTPRQGRPLPRGGHRIAPAARQPDRAGRLHRRQQGPTLRLHLHRALGGLGASDHRRRDAPGDGHPRRPQRSAGTAARAPGSSEGDRRPREPDRGVGAGASGQGTGTGPRTARPRVPRTAAPADGRGGPRGGAGRVPPRRRRRPRRTRGGRACVCGAAHGRWARSNPCSRSSRP